MTDTPQFPEYAISASPKATQTKRALPLELLPLLAEIEAELAENPQCHPDRVISASLDGKTHIYMHPDPLIQITFEADEERKVLHIFHYSAPAFRVQESIFISYAHTDREWLAKLRSFLTVLEQKGVVKFWDDGQLEAGLPWEEQIATALDAAKAGLLLISQEFLASKFIADTELPRLLDDATKKGKRIFWLPLSPSTVFESHEEITKFQALVDEPRTSLEELDDVEVKKVLVRVSKELGDILA